MKKGNKKKKKTKTISFKSALIMIILALAVAVGVYFFLTAEDEDTKLTLLEKQWIEKNKNTLISIKIPNNLSIYGSNGEGLLFDFINKVEDETGLNFNKISYNYPVTDENIKSGLSILTLKNTDELKDTDVLITEDSYVLIGKEEGFISDITSISGSSIGVIESDLAMVSNFSKKNALSIRSFSSAEAAFNSVNDGTVSYAIVPRYLTMDKLISSKNVFVKYNLGDFSNKIVLRLGNNKRLNNVLIKYLNEWKSNDYRKSFEEALMNYYVKNTSITDAEKSSLSSKIYTYGYVNNSALNINKSNKLYGLAGEYINTISTMGDIEIKPVAYSNSKKLVDAIKKGEVDFAFINFDYTNNDTIQTVHSFNNNLVGLSKSLLNINNKEGLNNRIIYSIKDTYLNSYLSGNFNAIVKDINNVSNKTDKTGILVLDEFDYTYYKDTKLDNYNLIFTDSYPNNYYYVATTNNKVIAGLLNYTLSFTSYNEYKNIAINNIENSFTSETNFKLIYMVVLAIILLPVLIIILTIAASKSKSNLKVLKKEDILKYTDLLTSLKNRNYLNAHINEWDETKVFPRTIIMVDLNNLKYVNDNYGHEEGNLLIKKGAAILMNTQLEKSEIIRTDGNEFLIYLIGYNKTQINTYISKLIKEFEKLPYGFGAAVGYSMIEDEITTVDDAINEATIEMRTDKEQNYK